MCTGVETQLAAAAWSAATAAAMKPKKPKIPEVQVRQPPQKSKTPSYTSLLDTNRKQSAASGSGSTFLTGPRGLPSLNGNVGANTLLGGNGRGNTLLGD